MGGHMTNITKVINMPHCFQLSADNYTPVMPRPSMKNFKLTPQVDLRLGSYTYKTWQLWPLSQIQELQVIAGKTTRTQGLLPH